MTATNTKVICFNYTGYCRSENVQCTESGTMIDARAIVDHARKFKVQTSDTMYLMGKSFGCAVAVNGSTLVVFEGLILESTFTSA